jgi:hypothetical protein
MDIRVTVKMVEPSVWHEIQQSNRPPAGTWSLEAIENVKNRPEGGNPAPRRTMPHSYLAVAGKEQRVGEFIEDARRTPVVR